MLKIKREVGGAGQCVFEGGECSPQKAERGPKKNIYWHRVYDNRIGMFNGFVSVGFFFCLKYDLNKNGFHRLICLNA